MTLIPDDPTDILADLTRLEKPFNFTRDQLGPRTCQVAARAILDNMEAEADPDGWPWPALGPSYEAWKNAVAPGNPIGVLWGHMRDTTQLEGEQRITIKRVEQEYGIDEKAKQEAAEFQEGGLLTGTMQPQRPFYAVGHHCADELDAHFDAHWNALP